MKITLKEKVTILETRVKSIKSIVNKSYSYTDKERTLNVIEDLKESISDIEETIKELIPRC